MNYQYITNITAGAYLFEIAGYKIQHVFQYLCRHLWNN